MEGNHTFMQSLESIREYLHQFMQHFVAADKRTAPRAPPLPKEDLNPDEQKQTFPNELFAHLLVELPTHRNDIADAYEARDMSRLGNSVHKLLGGASYCNAPELITCLRELRLALKSGDPKTIDFYYLRAIDVIDATLMYSGYRG